MLCRTSTIRHKDSGVSMRTPLLIPSFSSKGFARSKRDGKSEIGKILETASEFLTEICLISAYDIFYEHLPNPSDLPCKPEMIFVDSGGYEISTDRDYSSVIDPLPLPEPWTIENLKNVFDNWPEEIPAVFVSLDRPDDRKPFVAQVTEARQLFRTRRQHLTLLLLKPETKTQTTLKETISAAAANVAELGSFDIIGVTEKELGRTMLDRMAQIAKLRLAMDDDEIKVPLHIFGALDPLSVCLYFIAGAEIFDGLTWLRYAYSDGMCVYAHNYKVKENLNIHDDHVRTRILSDNYYAMQSLQQSLRDFETTHNFEKFGPHEELLKDAYDSLKTRFKGRL